jgi:hypothetical protein
MMIWRLPHPVRGKTCVPRHLRRWVDAGWVSVWAFPNQPSWRFWQLESLWSLQPHGRRQPRVALAIALTATHSSVAVTRGVLTNVRQ